MQSFWKSVVTTLSMFVTFQVVVRLAEVRWRWGTWASVALGMVLAAPVGLLAYRALYGKWPTS